MKILCAEYNEAGEAAIVPVGDDALLRNNDDFYLPGFAKELSCVPQLVVRIWGWSAYFVELDKEFQDHVMARQEYSV